MSEAASREIRPNPPSSTLRERAYSAPSYNKGGWDGHVVGGASREIARNVKPVRFTRSEDLVTFFIEINVASGGTVSTTIFSTLRNLNY